MLAQCAYSKVRYSSKKGQPCRRGRPARRRTTREARRDFLRTELRVDHRPPLGGGQPRLKGVGPSPRRHGRQRAGRRRLNRTRLPPWCPRRRPRAGRRRVSRRIVLHRSRRHDRTRKTPRQDLFRRRRPSPGPRPPHLREHGLDDRVGPGRCSDGVRPPGPRQRTRPGGQVSLRELVGSIADPAEREHAAAVFRHAVARRLRAAEAASGPRIIRTAKRCPSCRTERPVTQFGRNSARPDGLQSVCRACRR